MCLNFRLKYDHNLFRHIRATFTLVVLGTDSSSCKAPHVAVGFSVSLCLPGSAFGICGVNLCKIGAGVYLINNSVTVSVKCVLTSFNLLVWDAQNPVLTAIFTGLCTGHLFAGCLE